jgi:DNA-binding MarR family transcriptional regulator
MESKNTTEDQIAMNCACFNVRKAARAVTQLYDRVLKPTGLRGTQFTLLIALSRRGDIGISQLADVLIMERTTLTRNLKPLVKQGLAAVAEGSDRRTRTVRITAQGQDKIRQAIPYWEEAQAVIAEGLGSKGMAVMLNSISKVTSLAKET